MAQIISPVVQATIAGAIPVAGPPIHATISGLLSILQAIYVRLYNHSLAYTSVTQAIIECSSEIDHYLADHSVVFYSLKIVCMHSILRFVSGHLKCKSSVGPIVTLGFVTLVDATGRLHPIPMDVCDSFERFNEQPQLLFKHNSTQAQVQRRYIEQRQYDLCIDDDKQVTQLASRRWPSIQAGTTIVMRVVFEQKTRRVVEYTCHFCRAVNHVSRPKNLLQCRPGYSINW
ncbi:uncharacterized protein F5147DRAFT_564128 [Suillus discolor]|uniref:Ubiquitin-like domain-containing protein n=1 Tax=Suillus discolor TaxID=1912936 RepID=A0A9P7FKA9_9AGAM|nr:uncharacterized protein F5147DRAFT_564128 [Suillus discolor]KAG2119935.1 hypothetical protein F5147DRAFT_564128 [Suillus discolor]